jgi:hypothetical protein
MAIETARLGGAGGFAPPAGSLPGGPGGPGGGGGGFGGGGGGGLNPADYQTYAAAMKQLLQSKLYDTPAAQQNPLTAMVNPAVDADVANARGAFANIGNQVSQADPYLALIANRAPQLRPEMEQFLQGQGADTGQYGNAVNYANAQLGAGDQNWQNLARILGANHVAGQQGVVDTAKLQGEGIAQGLEGQRTQLNALAQMQQMQMDREAQQQAYQAQQEKAAAIMQLITQGLQYGQAPDLTGLV